MIVRSTIELGAQPRAARRRRGRRGRATSSSSCASCGCPVAQGFAISRPLPAPAFVDWVCAVTAARPDRRSWWPDAARRCSPSRACSSVPLRGGIAARASASMRLRAQWAALGALAVPGARARACSPAAPRGGTRSRTSRTYGLAAWFVWANRRDPRRGAARARRRAEPARDRGQRRRDADAAPWAERAAGLEPTGAFANSAPLAPSAPALRSATSSRCPLPLGLQQRAERGRPADLRRRARALASHNENRADAMVDGLVACARPRLIVRIGRHVRRRGAPPAPVQRPRPGRGSPRGDAAGAALRPDDRRRVRHGRRRAGALHRRGPRRRRRRRASCSRRSP